MARILIIDDEEVICMTLSKMLELDGHTITTASDGEKGIVRFRESQADVVITDLQMPNKEGTETIKELREISPDLKIIAMSGGGRVQSASFLDITNQLGVSAVLKKPFRMQVLRDAVNSCLETAGMTGPPASSPK